MNNNYVPTTWVGGKTVGTADVMNNIEQGIKNAHIDLNTIKNNIDIDGIKVHFPSRGGNKADCAIIETKESVTIIDVGWEKDASNLINYLIDKKLTKIDNLIISHYHDDHIGGVTGQGLETLINSGLNFNECVCYLPHKNIDYSRFIDNVANGSTDRVRTANETVVACLNKKGITIKYPTENEILSLGNNTNIKFLNTLQTYFNEYYGILLNNDTEGYTRYNNFSLVCELTHVNKKFLFTGDIEEKAQELLLNSISGNIDVYKVEHHGTNNTTYKDFLYKVNPKIAVLQNRGKIGLKGKMTTTYLYNKGCRLYDNTGCGDIIIKSNGIECFVESDGESKIDIGFTYCAQPYDLKNGIAIKENDDLNNYTSLGVFYCETSTISNTLLNRPKTISGGGFKLIVQARQLDSSPLQMIMDSDATIFTRAFAGGSYGEWKEVSTRAYGFINCSPSSDYKTTSTNAEKLSLKTISANKGSNLLISDGCVVIGSGVNSVKVSGQVGWSSDGAGTNVLEGYIYLNDSAVSRNAISSISTYWGVPLVTKIISVKEGDKISLYARSRTKEGFTVASSSINTWLCVEVV